MSLNSCAIQIARQFAAGDYATRLAMQEEAKTLPFGAVWDYCRESRGAPVGDAWLAEAKSCEKNVLFRR